VGKVINRTDSSSQERLWGRNIHHVPMRLIIIAISEKRVDYGLFPVARNHLNQTPADPSPRKVRSALHVGPPNPVVRASRLSATLFWRRNVIN